MLILRIRRAETALADGRLDEAFELARASDVQAHRRGQKLIGRLARALVERGQGHLDAGRLQQANSDCDKAAFLGGNLPEVAVLRTALAGAGEAAQRAARRREGVLAEARGHIREGRLSIGEACLAGTAPESAAEALREDVESTRARVESLLATARGACERGDWPPAVHALVEARRLHASNQAVSELVATVCTTLTARIEETLEHGRLDRACLLLESLQALRPDAVEARDAGRFLLDCQRAMDALRASAPREALAILKRLSSGRPGAAWLAQCVRDAVQASEALDNLSAGPLGLLGDERVSAQKTERIVPTPAVPAPARAAAPAGALPERLVLHVDGAGSCMVLRSAKVTIGAAGSSCRPDVPLMVASGAPAVSIERSEDDYFVVSDRPVAVNGVPIRRKLLASGDRIELSPRCGVRFELPNPASTSAVLTLFGTRLPSSDARRIVLLDRSLVVGPGRTAHVRCDQSPDQAVLYVRDGRLFCRTAAEITVDGRPMDRNAGLPLDGRVQVGAVGLVVKSV